MKTNYVYKATDGTETNYERMPADMTIRIEFGQGALLCLKTKRIFAVSRTNYWKLSPETRAAIQKCVYELKGKQI